VTGLYLLALLGAALVAVGEVAGIEARRGPWVDAVGTVAFLAAYWVWRAMRPWSGVQRPAGLWTAAAALLWLGISAAYRENEPPARRVLFAIGIVALGAREVVK
jgi:hypothetical protein